MRKEREGTKRFAVGSAGETNALSGRVMWPPAMAEMRT